MKPQELRHWIQRQDSSVSQLAEELEINPTTLVQWLNGDTPIPRMLELALEALANRRKAGSG